MMGRNVMKMLWIKGRLVIILIAGTGDAGGIGGGLAGGKSRGSTL